MRTQPRKLNFGEEFSPNVGVKHAIWCICAGLCVTHTAIVSLWKSDGERALVLCTKSVYFMACVHCLS